MLMMYVRNLVDLHFKFYTDGHEVDEDMMTICTYNGWYDAGDSAGIILRVMNDTPTLTSGDVAYKYNNKNSTPVMRVEF